VPFAPSKLLILQESLGSNPTLSASRASSGVLGTTSVQLRERKNGLLTPKRHQTKHLEFMQRWFGTRGSEVQILSPRPINLNPVIGIASFRSPSFQQLETTWVG
jgi:hypothetical protein